MTGVKNRWYNNSVLLDKCLWLLYLACTIAVPDPRNCLLNAVLRWYSDGTAGEKSSVSVLVSDSVAWKSSILTMLGKWVWVIYGVKLVDLYWYDSG